MQKKRSCPYCKGVVSYWSVIRPGLWGHDIIKCVHCNKELSRLWTMESLAVVGVVGVIQLVLVLLADRYLVYGFFVSFTLLVAGLLLVAVIGSLCVYYMIPFEAKTRPEQQE